MILNKKIKYYLLLAAIGCLFFFTGIKKIYSHYADHFSVRKIRSTWNFEHFPCTPLSEDKLYQLQSIFKQPFTYLGKGNQTYVFESQDHQYVLKFFKQKHFQKKHPFFLNSASSTLKNIYYKKQQARKERLRSLFESYLLAYQMLPIETGIEYLHLNKNFLLDQRVTLIDKIGFFRKIDLNEYEFVLQNKGIPLDKYLLEIDKKEAPEKIDFILNQVIKYIEVRCQKKISDSDESVMRNMALTLDIQDVFFIDSGFFTRDETLQQHQKIEEEIHRTLISIKKWTAEYFPELTPFVDKKIHCLFGMNTEFDRK